jgi:uncharacterized protein YdaU (DUF1376 family)
LVDEGTAAPRGPRAGKDPAFLLYVADALADERFVLMSTTQVGAYMLLLMFHWHEGSVPADEASLSRLARMKNGGAAWRAVWAGGPGAVGKCFHQHPDLPGRLVQKRMARTLAQRAVARVTASEAGRRGGRKSAQIRRDLQATVNPPSTMSLSLSRSISNPKIGTPETQPTTPQLTLSGPDGPTIAPVEADVRSRQDAIRWADEFRVLWQRHPGRGMPGEKLRKRNRAKAEAKYIRMKPDVDLSRRILAGHAAACASRQWIEGYVEDLHVWFGNRGWEDEDVGAVEGETQQERWAREQREGSRRWIEERKRQREGGGT